MPKRMPDKTAASVLDLADDLLADLHQLEHNIDVTMMEYGRAINDIKKKYEAALAPLKADRAAQDKALTALMKKGRTVLFADGDVVNRTYGSLIRNEEDKVTIPRDALDKCREQGLDDVVKVAYSLDRDAVEKWPDAKLILIGAERKPVEKFSYNIKGCKK